jgi:hypothetical protein
MVDTDSFRVFLELEQRVYFPSLLTQLKDSVSTTLQGTPAVLNMFVIALYVCKIHAESGNFFAS